MKLNKKQLADNFDDYIVWDSIQLREEGRVLGVVLVASCYRNHGSFHSSLDSNFTRRDIIIS